MSNDNFYINLRNAIIEQAVQDYCSEMRRFAELNDSEKSIERVKKDGLKRQVPVEFTDEEAEEERQQRIGITKSKMAEIEKFFHSEWYKRMCDIDGQYMLVRTKEKAIDDMVRLCIVKLRSINKKNIKSKKSQKAIRDYKTLKLFLKSEHLPCFVENDSTYYIQMILKESKCKFCDLV